MATPKKRPSSNRATARAAGERGPAQPPPPHPDFRPQLDGTLFWRMGDTDYALRPLTVGETQELDALRQYGGFDIMEKLRAAASLPALPISDQLRADAIREANERPEGTDEEKQAKIEAFEVARALPQSTPEERDAASAEKLAALKKANDENTEWLLGWYDRLFELAEKQQRPFPREHAPTWVLRSNTMLVVMGALEGPLPPGVV